MNNLKMLYNLHYLILENRGTKCIVNLNYKNNINKIHIFESWFLKYYFI